MEKDQNFGVRSGFGVGRCDGGVAQRQLGRAAIAVGEADDAVDVMQLDADRQVVPERGVPGRELGENDADRPAGDDEVAVFVAQAWLPM